MVTMKDVANRAGVSTSTVSRVLNGKERGRIKPDIAREVRRQAELLGYKPNPVARSLRTHSSRILGFVSDEISTTPFAGRIMLGAQDAARELGYILLAYLGADVGDTIAFGDARVDIPMLEYCAYGVAMGSGGDEIKAMADLVTDGVDEDGLYNAFVKLGLIEAGV